MILSYKAARVNAGYTVQQAADAVGISHTGLTYIETYRSMPRFDTYYKLCKLYKIKPEEFEWRFNEIKTTSSWFKKHPKKKKK